jgi:tetratricopeptide (TPR) repeat protein
MVRAHSLGRIYSTLATNRFEAGDLAAATRSLARGFATQRQVGECYGCDALLYPAAVPIYIALDALDLAEQACEKAEEIASGFRSRSWVGTARYLLGLLASARKDWDAARHYLEQAIDVFDSLGQPYESARCAEAMADAAREAGNRESARLLLEKAASIYERLEASGRAAEARSRAAALPA